MVILIIEVVVMIETEANDVDIREFNLTLNEQIAAAAIKNNPKIVELDTDKDGNIIVDKKLHPEIYDWAANG